MKLLSEHHSFMGMQRDINVLKHPPAFLYDAKNIRLTAREGNTLLAISNEKGTVDTEIKIEGEYLGSCKINKYLVVFTTSSDKDYIYRIDLDNLNMATLYIGNLGFETPIDAVSSYENENIQKVYWVDGKAQPRVINIAGEVDGPGKPLYPEGTSFDFIPKLKLQEEVKVKKILGTGEFPAGVVQYAFTYYNKWGQESNVFHTTPLQYISSKGRAGSPEEKVANAFKLSISNLDTDNFEYLRIYSILRTSLNGTPVVKRLQDVKVQKLVEYIDAGVSGDIIDPTELLYKGGEVISASSIATLDNTLFLGNISIKREAPDIKDSLLEYSGVSSDNPVFPSMSLTPNPLESCLYERKYLLEGEEMPYIDTLNTSDSDYPGSTAFKSREYYRLGIQFQHETGRWSEPYWIGDSQCTKAPSYTIENGVAIVQTPGFKYTLSDSNIIGTLIIETLKKGNYIKARPVFAYPQPSDRTVLCQGVLSPTVYRDRDRYLNGVAKGPIYAQSSWLFRTYLSSEEDGNLKANGAGKVTWKYGLYSQYNKNKYSNVQSPYIFSTEISGIFNEEDTYRVDPTFVTVHSPDLIFDDSFHYMDFSTCSIYGIGTTKINNTYSDIDIRTSSDTIGTSAGGFLHKSIKSEGHSSLVSGLFYEDKIVDDVSGTPPYIPYKDSTGSIQKWFVTLWHKKGSLNNDVNREGRSAQLLKKVVSNFKLCGEITALEEPINYNALGITLFKDDQVSIVKSGDKVYMGNVDTMVTPNQPSPHYFNGNYKEEDSGGVADNVINWKLDRSIDSGEDKITPGIYKYSSNDDKWSRVESDIGNETSSLVNWREGVSIKYKSTPHIVASIDDKYRDTAARDSLVLVELYKPYDKDVIFGGASDDAMKAAIWIPCGPSVEITEETVLEYRWGDSYFQRFDCLKTYPFTREDINQVVEIASFMVETRVNLGGRYDKNKGQISNLNASPENFNLINPVYSQPDNFFSYRILDEDYYSINNFPNQITWSKAKQSGAEIDLWTNITMASTYDVDGTKGAIKALKVWKDALYCFQDKGISNILFNSRVQIPVSDGVPIELGNSNKLEGHRYLTEGYGCSNKELIKSCNSGLYFIDDTTNHLMYIGEGIKDVSTTNNMGSWFNSNTIDKIEYDAKYSDIYLVGKDNALCFSEVLGQFTSFFDYGGIALIETYKNTVFTLKNGSLYKMFEGDYNYIFDDWKPWEFTFITNGSKDGAQDLSKIFSTIDYRMDVEEGNNYKPDSTLNYISVEDGYQETDMCTLNRLKSVDNPKSYHHKDTNLQKKFRTWRIQIPRNKGTMDRIRDNWCKITLGSNSKTNNKAILYDLNVQYYV